MKIKLLSDMGALKRYAHGKRADLPVAQWLRQRNVPRRLVAEFWQPLVWGALNTPLEHASLRILCNVLSDGVWADKSGSDYLLPKRDLGAIIAEPALAKLKKYGADIRLETRVGRLKNLADRICRRYGAMAGVSRRTRFADKRSCCRHQRFRSRRSVQKPRMGGESPCRRKTHLPLFGRTRSRPRYHRKTGDHSLYA